MKKIFPFLVLGFLVCLFFWQFLIKGLLPIPADTIIGLYHPFRDLYSKEYPNGIPFKNFLITDPVRQQYPWRELAISLEKKFQLPLWNPYNFSGTPLLANFQSASFYPLNLLFFIMPFTNAWSLIIILGPLLGGIFLFLYLGNLKLNIWVSLLGSVSYAFSGFFVSWMEWGTITHVALWFPLILFAIDKIFLSKKNFKWSLLYLFALVSAFFAGHLQIFFYLFIFSSVYFFARWMQFGWQKKVLFLSIILNSLFIILTSVQWIPTLQFIQLSARNIDVVDIANPGWFIPWQNLVQFIAPDFFGNPTTLNYWGVWNYGELIGYIGITSLIFSLLAIFSRRDKKTLFFGLILLVSLVFSLPTFVAKIPFNFHIPFLETAQPTRLLFIITFSLAVLSALGLDYYLKHKKKILIPVVLVGLFFVGLWGFVVMSNLDPINMAVIKNNLKLPTIIFMLLVVILFLNDFIKKGKYATVACVSILLITIFDLFRFGWKFEPFTQKEYLFPSTSAINFLQKNVGEFRIMSTDSRILPPNFSTVYRLKSIDGYDPLYLLRYGELMVAMGRKKADISPPFGFNRIITPQNYDSKMVDLLGVKYVLSLSDLNSPKLKKVFREGQTRVYENTSVLPRAFFVSRIINAKDNRQAIEIMFEDSFNLNRDAIVENSDELLRNIKNTTIGKANIIHYSENRVIIETENLGIGFLVFTESFYPTWKVKIDQNKIQEKIYRTDYNFRGVIVPAGKHKVEFYNSLF